MQCGATGGISASGIILAGGRSSRFGRDKSLELLCGEPLIRQVRDRLVPLFPDILIIANDLRKYEFLEEEVRPDVIQGLGPLGGVYSGLLNMKHDWGFFAACDMPFIHDNLVRAMFDLRVGHDVVVPRVGDKIEPLHAFYHRRCLEPVKRLFESGRRQIFLFYPEVRVRYLDEEELRSFDPEMRSFFNINFPEEMPGKGIAKI